MGIVSTMLIGGWNYGDGLDLLVDTMAQNVTTKKIWCTFGAVTGDPYLKMAELPLFPDV